MLQYIHIKEEHAFIIKSRSKQHIYFEKYDYEQNKTIWKRKQKENVKDVHPDERPDNVGRYEYNSITK